MGCDTYSVWYKDVMLADKMSLGNAMIFVEALFHTFWKEAGEYTIKKNESNEYDRIEKIPINKFGNFRKRRSSKMEENNENS